MQSLFYVLLVVSVVKSPRSVSSQLGLRVTNLDHLEAQRPAQRANMFSQQRHGMGSAGMWMLFICHDTGKNDASKLRIIGDFVE